MFFDAQSVRDLRLWHGMTMTEFAKLVGVSYQCVQQWEAGKASPRPRHQKRLAEIFAKSYPPAPTPPVSELRDSSDVRSVIRAILDSGMSPDRKLDLIRKVVEK